MTLDGKAFAEELAGLVKDYIRRQVEPLTQRIAVLESGGKKALRFRGIWNDNASYQSGDCIIHRGSVWVCKTANRGNRPPSNAWRIIVKNGALDEPRAGVSRTRTVAAKARPSIGK